MRSACLGIRSVEVKVFRKTEGSYMFDFQSTMKEMLDQEVAEGYVAGASALVLHKGREMFYHDCGFADREAAVPMKRDTIIRLYSMTKPITAAAVMVLAERGDIDLWDPVSRYLPEFAHQKVWTDKGEVPALRAVTIWDLMNMTSGITYPCEDHEPGRRMGRVLKEFLESRERGERIDTREYLRRIAEVPLCFQPGAGWLYGYSADVLGGVIEAVGGMPFGEFLQKELLVPLEMPDTGFSVPAEKRARFAASYDFDQSTVTLTHVDSSHLGEFFEGDVAFESGGAGLVSTIEDYSHFARMMLNKGIYKGQRILGKKTVEFMAQNHLKEEQGKTVTWDSMRGYGYGCLMRVLTDQSEAGTIAPLGEYGWDGWTGNYVIMDPKDDLCLLYFIQRRGAGGATPLVRRLRMAAYAALED